MAKLFKKSVEWGNNFSNVWGLLPATWQTGMVGVMSGLTVYLGLGEVGKAQAIFYASGVFAFGLGCVFLSLRISQILGMFQRLSIIHTHVNGWSFNNLANPTQITFLNGGFVLRNDSQRIMFYKLKRVHLSIETIGPKNSNVDESVVPISPFGGTQGVNCASIINIPFDLKKSAPEGTLEVQILYGDSKDSLDYLLTYKATVHVALTKVNKDWQASLPNQLKLLHHESV